LSGRNAGAEHFGVANLVGKQENQPRVKLEALLLVEALMRLDQLCVEAISILQIRLSAQIGLDAQIRLSAQLRLSVHAADSPSLQRPSD
jgi:hypothetical protein